jgi:aromatic ring-opening dioxygenase LigB subunit
MTPGKSNLILYLQIEQNEETTNQLETTDLKILSYDWQWKFYRLRFTKQEYDKNRDLLKSLMEKAYGEYPNYSTTFNKSNKDWIPKAWGSNAFQNLYLILKEIIV